MPTLNQTPEQIARDNIDRQLAQCGWTVQNKDAINWSAAPLAVRHYLTQDGKEADYSSSSNAANRLASSNPKKRKKRLPADGMRDCQITAINNLETSFKDNRPRALIQMATGAGNLVPQNPSDESAWVLLEKIKVGKS